ncbi:hypothetical protein QMK54_04840 [Pseudomonas sp. P5_109]|jgi:hypothetical protein|uniref:hypothetical protein n=1 Tax=Pseudomonas sp. P5_109 TaxID=3043441 RepID=UPI002A368426|nr:hypothetical protein [Pseudomonas sp. P5_109]WPN31095.1 hypothetical protein QMK54_04840 [Pseudomonas sp. P5_109]
MKEELDSVSQGRSELYLVFAERKMSSLSNSEKQKLVEDSGTLLKKSSKGLELAALTEKLARDNQHHDWIMISAEAQIYSSNAMSDAEVIKDLRDDCLESLLKGETTKKKSVSFDLVVKKYE